ncbi:TPA: hypothetical protein L4559_003545 [Pseudomonas aeruginosa]|nr:hypothetical protein [Pseudomonas aeruginosa]
MMTQPTASARSYAIYADAVAAYGITPITEAQWADWQNTLPTAKVVDMPPTLNQGIALALEAGDLNGATQMIAMCNAHDQECWSQYTTEGECFPAGGLWFSKLDWIKGSRPDASPLTVAHVLDYDGELPEALTHFELDNTRYYFTADEVVVHDPELGLSFLFFHGLSNPSVEAIVGLINKSKGE